MSLVHPRPRQRDSRSFPAIPASGGAGLARSPSPMGRRSGGACRKMVVWCLFAGPLVSEPARLLWEKVDISQVPRSPKGSQNCRRGNDPRPITSDTNCGLRLWEGFGRFRGRIPMRMLIPFGS